MACYRGLGPRRASMSMFSTRMITIYEFLKQLSMRRNAQELILVHTCIHVRQILVIGKCALNSENFIDLNRA